MHLVVLHLAGEEVEIDVSHRMILSDRRRFRLLYRKCLAVVKMTRLRA